MRSLQGVLVLVIAALLLSTGCARSQEAKNGTAIAEAKNQGTATVATTQKGADQTGTLDGKTFVGTTTEVGKEKGEAENLVFADGTFRSKECDQYGFTAAPYSTRTEGDAVVWEATCTSEKEGKMVWAGRVSGATIEGKVTWIKEGQNNIEYTFTGSIP